MLRPAVVKRPATGRSPRGFLLAMLVCTPLISGYVLPPAKVLQRWFRDGPRPRVTSPILLPVRVGERAGQLYLDRSGTRALALEGRFIAADSGEGALWRALDLLLVPNEEAAATDLELSGMDLTRAGYARDASSADGVAYTLGARGEGEAELDQVWFCRSPLRLCRLRWGGSEVEVGPPESSGWPAWFRLADGDLLEVAGEAVPALVRPDWAAPSASTLVPGHPDPLDAWRRAFDSFGP